MEDTGVTARVDEIGGHKSSSLDLVLALRETKSSQTPFWDVFF